MVQALGQQGDLRSILAFDKSFHLPTSTNALIRAVTRHASSLFTRPDTFSHSLDPKRSVPLTFNPLVSSGGEARPARGGCRPTRAPARVGRPRVRQGRKRTPTSTPAFRTVRLPACPPAPGNKPGRRRGWCGPRAARREVGPPRSRRGGKSPPTPPPASGTLSPPVGARAGGKPPPPAALAPAGSLTVPNAGVDVGVLLRPCRTLGRPTRAGARVGRHPPRAGLASPPLLTNGLKVNGTDRFGSRLCENVSGRVNKDEACRVTARIKALVEVGR